MSNYHQDIEVIFFTEYHIFKVLYHFRYCSRLEIATKKLAQFPANIYEPLKY